MSVSTIPEDFRGLFEEPALGQVSYHNERGQIVTFPMWVDYDGEHVITSSRVGSAKGASLPPSTGGVGLHREHQESVSLGLREWPRGGDRS